MCFLLGNDTRASCRLLLILQLLFSIYLPLQMLWPQFNQQHGSPSSITILYPTLMKRGGDQQLGRTRYRAKPVPLSTRTDHVLQMHISDIEAKCQRYRPQWKAEHWDRRGEDFRIVISGTASFLVFVFLEGTRSLSVVQQIIKASIIFFILKKAWGNIFQPFTKSRGQNHTF